ncbi:MAG: EAL domain-containing protein, partial [Cyanobacteria bacterium J06628_6]
MSSHLLARSSISSTAGFSYFRREFQLHYQPIVSFKTGRIHAFEALVRWQKAGMMLYPAE